MASQKPPGGLHDSGGDVVRRLGEVDLLGSVSGLKARLSEAVAGKRGASQPTQVLLSFLDCIRVNSVPDDIASDYIPTKITLYDPENKGISNILISAASLSGIAVSYTRSRDALPEETAETLANKIKFVNALE